VPADAAQLRGFLERHLPEYMVPGAIVALDSLPLMPNGKLDRAALPVPESSGAENRQGHVAPRTPVEEMLAAIWATVLRVERVGIRDNFFALGGHSLLATQVVSRIRTEIGLELPLSALFEEPTIAELAARVSSELLAGLPPQGPVLARVSRDTYRSEPSGILHRTENH
jgi:acyl carrier protein